MLLDYYSWRQQNDKPYDPFTSRAIQLEDLLAVATAQNVKFEVGDILLVRSGYTTAYYEYEKSYPKKLDEAGSGPMGETSELRETAATPFKIRMSAFSSRNQIAV